MLPEPLNSTELAELTAKLKKGIGHSADSPATSRAPTYTPLTLAASRPPPFPQSGIDPAIVQQVRSYSEALAEPEDVIEVRRLPSGESDWLRPGEFVSAVPRLMRQNVLGKQNIYVGVNPRKAIGVKGDVGVAVARCQFADFDHTSVEEARRRIAETGLPKPTLILNSGHGVHVYWRLNEPVTDMARWTNLQKRLASLLNSDPVVCNPERIMRLPGFTNHKPPAASCVLVECDPTWVYPLAQIESILPPMPALVALPGPVGEAILAGNRNATLTSLAGTMRRRGMSGDSILAALRTENASKCVPPLEDAEVQAIAASVSKYPPALVLGGPVLVCMADVERKEVSWLWQGRIALGRITLFVGKPGEGKSFVTLDMASRVSTGSAWPDRCQCPIGSVIIVSAEDDLADTIGPRLDAMHANCHKIHSLTMVRHIGDDGKPHEVMFSLENIAALETAIQQHPDCRLIVIDPIGSFLGGQTDAHRDNEVRSVLAPVAALAERYGVAVVVVAHRRKSIGPSADDSAMGSRAFTGIARSVWHLSRDQQNKARRLFLPGKNNLAPEGDGLAFTIGGCPPSIFWESQPVTMSADEAMAIENAGVEKPGPEPEARDAATDWLAAELADGAEHRVAALRASAEAAGLAWRTVQRAAEVLGVKSHRTAAFGGEYVWQMPPSVPPTVPSPPKRE